MKSTSRPSIVPFFYCACFFCAIIAQAQQPDQAGYYATTQTMQVASPTTLAEQSGTPQNNKKETLKLDLKAGQRKASFSGLSEYVKDNLAYPEIAKAYGVEGTVEILATISAAGEVLEAVVTQSLGDDCDKAALDLVKKMPLWQPASNFGIPVKSKAKLQLAFRLH